MSSSVEQPVRQACVIYVKNLIGGSWAAKDVEASPAAIASGQVRKFCSIFNIRLTLTFYSANPYHAFTMNKL